MQLLEDRIRKEGVVRDGDVLMVDGFLNHQMDPALFTEMAREWLRLFDGCGVNKILTVEASGIGIAAVVGQQFGCPVVFAKKSRSRNVVGEVFCAVVHSFTHGTDSNVIVSKKFLHPGDRVLLIDDFLANGAALEGLLQIVQQSGAEVIGAGIAVEKAFQPGGDRLRGQGLRIESLARIRSMSQEDGIVFC